MIGVLKTLAPLSLYVLALVLVLLALSGRTRFTLAYVAFLVPLRNIVERFQGYPVGNHVIDMLIISMLVGLLVSSVDKGWKVLEPTPVNGAAFLMVLYTFLSLQWGNHYLNTILFFDTSDPRVQDWKNFCLLPVLYLVTLNGVRDKKWVWRVFAITCFSMLLMDYYSTGQIRWYSSLVSRAKITGTFQFLGPNEVAAFYSEFTVVLIGVYVAMKKGVNRLLLLGLIMLNSYCMVFMYSRAAYIAMAAGMVFLFMNKGRKWLIPMLIVIVCWQAVLPEKAKERIQGTKDEYGHLEESAERRVQIWEHAWEIFQNNSILGIGYGVFRHLGFDLKDTHNIYLKILVEQGVVGMLCFILVIFAFLLEGLRLYQKGEDELSKGFGLGFMACIVVLLINNIFGDRWSYFELSSYLWIYAGLVSRLNRLPHEVVPIMKKSGNRVKLNTAPAAPKPGIKIIPKSDRKPRYY